MVTIAVFTVNSNGFARQPSQVCGKSAKNVPWIHILTEWFVLMWNGKMPCKFSHSLYQFCIWLNLNYRKKSNHTKSRSNIISRIIAKVAEMNGSNFRKKQIFLVSAANAATKFGHFFRYTAEQKTLSKYSEAQFFIFFFITLQQVVKNKPNPWTMDKRMQSNRCACWEQSKLCKHLMDSVCSISF